MKRRHVMERNLQQKRFRRKFKRRRKRMGLKGVNSVHREKVWGPTILDRIVATKARDPHIAEPPPPMTPPPHKRGLRDALTKGRALFTTMKRRVGL